jgi:hypothetical protein
MDMPDGVLGIVRVLRAARGDSDLLLRLETQALSQKRMHSGALAAATKWLETEPSSDEAKKLARMIKGGLPRKRTSQSPSS